MAEVAERVARLEERLDGMTGAMAELKIEIAELRLEMKSGFAEMRAEFSAVRREFGAEGSGIRGEMNTQFRWIMGGIGGATLTIIVTAVAAILATG